MTIFWNFSIVMSVEENSLKWQSIRERSKQSNEFKRVHKEKKHAKY